MLFVVLNDIGILIGVRLDYSMSLRFQLRLLRILSAHTQQMSPLGHKPPIRILLLQHILYSCWTPFHLQAGFPIRCRKAFHQHLFCRDLSERDLADQHDHSMIRILIPAHHLSQSR